MALGSLIDSLTLTPPGVAYSFGITYCDHVLSLAIDC